MQDLSLWWFLLRCLNYFVDKPMYRLFEFIKKVYILILFIGLEIIAFSYYYKSSIYTNAKIVVALNSVTGGLQGYVYDIKSFFNLKQENERLNRELNEFKNKIALMGVDTLSTWNEVYDSTRLIYSYMPANVVNNSYIKQNNYITLNKGYADGVEKDMSILMGDNIVGYVLDCSENYSVGISVLNTKFKTSGRDAGGSYTGAIGWNGVDVKMVNMSEIPKYADIDVGDTILTTSFSSKFPDGAKIGVVKNIELVNATYHNAGVELFADFTTLSNVSIVKFKDYKEKTELENSVE